MRFVFKAVIVCISASRVPSQTREDAKIVFKAVISLKTAPVQLIFPHSIVLMWIPVVPREAIEYTLARSLVRLFRRIRFSLARP